MGTDRVECRIGGQEWRSPRGGQLLGLQVRCHVNHLREVNDDQSTILSKSSLP
jgi:hypothetical protein